MKPSTWLESLTTLPWPSSFPSFTSDVVMKMVEERSGAGNVRLKTRVLPSPTAALVVVTVLSAIKRNLSSRLRSERSVDSYNWIERPQKRLKLYSACVYCVQPAGQESCVFLLMVISMGGEPGKTQMSMAAFHH